MRPSTKCILPSSYQFTNGCEIADKTMLLKFLQQFPNDLAASRIKSITEAAKNCSFKPTWGVKIDRSGHAEYELYCYNYTPTDRRRDRCGQTLSLQQMCEIMKIQHYDTPETKKSVMFSFDLDNNEPPNFYYIDCVHSADDAGVSKKNGIIQNKYYRYKPGHPVGQFEKYLNKEYVPFDHDPEIKVVFFADKLKRGYIGAYYDGITFETLQKIMSDTGFDFLNNTILNTDKRFSVSIDYDKESGDVMRIGIYGILY